MNMNTIKKSPSRWMFFILSLICATPYTLYGNTDDDIDVVFMTVSTNNGQNESIMLSNDTEFTGPLFCPSEKTITINGTCYNTEDVKAIRFETRQVDAIQNAEQVCNRINDGIIYNLNGQVVGKIDADEAIHFPSSLEALPKGIYIINGKKHIKF